MVSIDELVVAALAGDALALRSMAQEWLAENPDISSCVAPKSTDATHTAVAAGLVEMIAERRKQAPPAWTRAIPPAPKPIYLLKAAQTMRRLRRLCESESPLPLRRRNVLVPPTFLEFA